MHAIAPKRLSFLAFCVANVLIDVEPLYFMLTRQYPLHRLFHTFVGATAVAVATVALFLVARSVAFLPNAFRWKSLTPSQVGMGAALGVYSHVALDSLMHPDIRPFSPFSQGNPLLHAVSLSSLHWSCLLAGIAGVCLLSIRRLVGGHNAP